MKGKHWIPAFAGMTFLLLLAMTTTMTGVAYAETCAYRDGGYCVSAIAGQTAQKLGMPTEMAVWGKSKWGEAVWASEGVLGGTEYLNYYGTIWDKMVKDGKATQKDREEAFGEAKKAGGTKIGGVNLVVLSAATLQKLIDSKVLTKEEAQEILNGAKVAPSPPSATASPKACRAG